MKRIISLVLLATLAIFNVHAAETEQLTEPVAQEQNINEPKIYNLTLEEAIDMAFTDNPRLITNQYIQTGNKINYEAAHYAKKQYKNVTVNITSGFEAHCIKMGYYENAAKMQYDLSVMEYDQIKHRIAYDVTSAYYNCALAQKLVNAAQNSYDMAVANFNKLDAQYKLGLVAQLDYESASLSVTQAKNALDSYKLSSDIANQNLKIQILKDKENCTVVVSDDVDCSDFTADVNMDIELAMESRYDLTALKGSRELATQYYDLAEALTVQSATYNTAYASYVKADYDYTNTKKLISLSILSDYNKILTTKSDMHLAGEVYSIKNKMLESAKMKYELGLITNNDLTKSINELYEAQVSYANAKVAYRLAVEKYKYEITLGL